MDIISIADLSRDDVAAIWAMVQAPGPPLDGAVGWSFEGNGIRTRASFIQAFRDLGLAFTELPNLLKTAERAADLAGYLDPYFRLYVIRESDHGRLRGFAGASARPVINAMSGLEHPCEVLTDAYFIDRSLGPLGQAEICLWGPTTNVFRSWHHLARLLGARLTQVCRRHHHEELGHVEFREDPPRRADVVITDAWPAGAEEGAPALTEAHLAQMGSPALLPTPPFAVGRELGLDPAAYPGFVGYGQKGLLLPVQRAILRHALAG